MPSKPLNPCSVPGCPELVSGGRCEAHSKQDKARRAETGNSAYKTTRWQRIRKAYLYRHPWCVLCARQATVADHYPLSRKQLVAQGVEPDTPSRLRPLCAPCHNKETAKHQPGGWASERKAPRRRA
jgi:5-methylcytosine-specific restriction protein A